MHLISDIAFCRVLMTLSMQGDNLTSLTESSKRGRVRRKKERPPLFDKLLVVLPTQLRGGALQRPAACWQA